MMLNEVRLSWSLLPLTMVLGLLIVHFTFPVIQIVQQEQAKRTALESRLHSQLLLQSESMVS